MPEVTKLYEVNVEEMCRHIGEWNRWEIEDAFRLKHSQDEWADFDVKSLFYNHDLDMIVKICRSQKFWKGGPYFNAAIRHVASMFFRKVPVCS